MIDTKGISNPTSKVKSKDMIRAAKSNPTSKKRAKKNPLKVSSVNNNR